MLLPIVDSVEQDEGHVYVVDTPDNIDSESDIVIGTDIDRNKWKDNDRVQDIDRGHDVDTEDKETEWQGTRHRPGD